jgi:hypothetical protein
MDRLEQSFREHIQADNTFNSFSSKKFEKAVRQVTGDMEKTITYDLLSMEPKMHVGHRKEHDGFAARNFKRWRGAFDRSKRSGWCARRRKAVSTKGNALSPKGCNAALKAAVC